MREGCGALCLSLLFIFLLLTQAYLRFWTFSLVVYSETDELNL